MASVRPRIAGLAGSLAIAASVLLASPSLALAKPGGNSYPCSGGSIPGATYDKLVVTGVCMIDQGNVTVTGDVEVRPGAALIAVTFGSDLWVGHDIEVARNGVLVLGCEPEAFDCQGGQGAPTLSCASIGKIPCDFSSNDTVVGDIEGHDAYAIIVHHVTVNHDIEQHGGGGGAACNFPDGPVSLKPVTPPPPDWLPFFEFGPYSTYEDTWVGHDVSIEHVSTCWLGFFRNHVGHTVNYNYNVTADPDGNEIQTNWIGDDLNCRRNSPAPQQGDSGGDPNIVIDHATGQCAGLTQPQT